MYSAIGDVGDLKVREDTNFRNTLLVNAVLVLHYNKNN